jgi:hypothetical protein
MNFTYSRYLRHEFQTWCLANLAVIKEYFTPEVEAEYETLEDWAVELYLTIKTEA